MWSFVLGRCIPARSRAPERAPVLGSAHRQTLCAVQRFDLGRQVSDQRLGVER